MFDITLFLSLPMK